jgi:hypothetical protein
MWCYEFARHPLSRFVARFSTALSSNPWKEAIVPAMQLSAPVGLELRRPSPVDFSINHPR